MIYTLTFNPSLDYVIAVEDFQTGKMNRTASEMIYAGGKGINVSIVLKELGVESVPLGFVAGFTGQELQRMLQEQGIRTDFIEVEQGHTRINMKLRTDILIEPETDGFWHQETEVNGQGPLITEEELELLLQKIDSLTENDILVISGSVCRGVPQSIYADITKRCREKNVRVVVDASSVLLWNVLEHGPFLIKPNIDELEDLFYRDIDRMDEVIFYAKELQNRGARNVLVSLGKDGAVLVTENGDVYEKEAPKGDVINSVGAGDSMVAGFLAGLLQTQNYEKAMKLGLCAGSATAFSEGLAKEAQIKDLLA